MKNDPRRYYVITGATVAPWGVYSYDEAREIAEAHTRSSGKPAIVVVKVAECTATSPPVVWTHFGTGP